MKILWISIAVFWLGCQPSGNKTGTEKGSVMPKYTNHLINETSPYLLQHAHNPVEWYPWGEEAFKRAREEDKPILLSIGYSACHWCHVMEHESFENEKIAALMNKNFICIKVDREERPDVDQVYMKFVQMFTGSGGWPMTVFLTPERQPFYGGTYFPPEDRYGKPGFKKLLALAADFYHNRKSDLVKNLEQTQNAFNQAMHEKNSGTVLPDKKTFRLAIEQLSRYYDADNGGIRSAPKFPNVQIFALFLRAWKNTGQEHYLNMVEHTLKKMAEGGIYDQLGGGFARYSVDGRWFAPHFEKMLYDNAQLVNLYLETFQATGNSFYLNIAEESLGFVLRELHSAEGGFYSTLDADSEGKEGLFYLWTRAEIYKHLDENAANIFCSRYNVSTKGNFEGKNILHIVKSVSELAAVYHLSESKVDRILKDSKQKLFTIRAQRIRPGLDSKVILSWNGLMLSAFARAFQVTGNPKYKEVVEQSIRFIQTKMTQNGLLLHTYKDGQAKYDGYLDDYANVIQGLLDSYEAVFDEEFLRLALRLSVHVNREFWDDQNQGYFYTSSAQEKLIHRLKDEQDQSIPSGTGIMASNLLRLYTMTEQPDLLNIAEKIFTKYEGRYISNPHGFASHLIALDFYLTKPQEVIVVSPPGDNYENLLTGIWQNYIPNKVLAIEQPASSTSFFAESLFEGRTAIDGTATAYVCHNFSCSLPVTSSAELLKLLKN